MIIQTDVVGCNYYSEAFRSVCEKNAQYSSRDVTRITYEFYPYTGDAELIREPKNEHDKNAVMVMVAGQKVGYIPAAEAPEIGELLRRRRVLGVSVRLFGGNYKQPRMDADGRVYTVPDSSPLRGVLKINVKDTRPILLALCIFGGIFGLHRFYRGEIVKGLLYLFTGGGFLVFWIRDIALIATGRMK